MLHVHDLLPHFTVSTAAGQQIAYGSLWQRKALLLVCVPRQSQAVEAYGRRLSTAFSEMRFDDAECIVTTNAVPGLTCPSAIVADRWGEIFFLESVDAVEDLPAVQELIEWLRYVQMHCPECEGEAR
jgi:hypothetical protein